MKGKRFVKFIGKCRVVKVVRSGDRIKTTMKCSKGVAKKIISAQEVIDSA